MLQKSIFWSQIYTRSVIDPLGPPPDAKSTNASSTNQAANNRSDKQKKKKISDEEVLAKLSRLIS